jgi:tetratricopeptide (TPR) repeat protein
MSVRPRRHAVPATARRRTRCFLASLLLVGAAVATAPAVAQRAASAPEANSGLDAPLFYQLLIGEMELRSGQAGTAYEVILDAARRTQDVTLFRRAVDIALQGRAGEQALAATRAWRTAAPTAVEPLRYQLQILTALNRVPDTAEPLRAMLALTPEAERGGLIAALPRFFQRADPKLASSTVEEALRPYAKAAATQVPVRVARARLALADKDSERALQLAREAHQLEPEATGPALLALELVPTQPAAESLVTSYLAQPRAEPALRLAYVRTLTNAQRYADAVTQLETYTRQRPEEAAPWLSLGALHLELRHPREGEAALQRYVGLAQQALAGAPAATGAASNAAAADDDAPDDDRDDGDEGNGTAQGLVQAWLMLAQAAEQRGDFKAAETWLARVDDPQRALEVQTRRAAILARQGKLAQARELIRKTPERQPEDARAKLMAEAGVLRDVKRWREAFDLLAAAGPRYSDDADLMYEQAMMAEKIDQLDEMERLLRRVIVLKPDSPHAHNALGYSLADRGRRLPEARELIQQALKLAPGDPFITDSLGWVEFRLGNRDEALRLLRQAYAARPDPEIGAHLGEVLWANGERDAARSIWRQAKVRDAANEVLRETLARLKADL